MTIAECIGIFLSQQKPTTKASYKYVLKNFTQFIGHDIPIKEITIVNMGAYSNYLGEKNYAVATWNKFVKTLKTFFNWCVRKKIIKESPAVVLQLHSSRGLIKKDKAFPDDELMKLITYAQINDNKRLLALVLFCADTGCRRGGASRLRIRDIDFEKNIATITEKGDASRRVKYHEWAAAALQDWLHSRNNVSEYVFTENEAALSPSGVSQYLRRYCQRAGIRGRGVHSLRHRKGFQFSDARISPVIAQLALGHSNIKTTMDHYYPQDWERTEAAFDEVATKPPVSPENPKVLKVNFKQAQ